MFNAFTAGQVDITDWPVQPGDLPSFESNPDFFVTSSTPDFGIFQLDINEHPSFLGVAQHASRTTTIPGIIGTPTSVPSCSSGFGRLNVVLVNLENSSSIVKDSLNTVTVTGPQTFTVTDSADGATNEPDGIYVFPGPTSCMLAGTYTVSSLVYNGTGSVFINTAMTVNATLGVNYRSSSNSQLTQTGIEVRRALAHMIDKPNFVLNVASIAGQGDYDDIQVPEGQGLSVNGAPFSKLPQSILDEDCLEHPWFNPGNCHPVSAYNLVSDNIGGGSLWWGSSGAQAGAISGYSGVADLRAACDNLVKAGFSVVNGASATDCAGVANALQGSSAPACASTTPYSCPHLAAPAGAHLVMYIRTHAPRKAFGQIFADTINAIFGTPNNGGTVCYGPLTSGACPAAFMVPNYYGFTDISSIIFADGFSPDTWNLYTGGFLLTSTPDHLYGYYHSSFASNVCGGVGNVQPSNYIFHCDPVYDSRAFAGEFSGSLSNANGFFGGAAVTAHRAAMTVPVFSVIDHFVGLNGWNFEPGTTSSLVNVLGHGFQLGYQSLLNMHQKPGYVPANSKYVAGGGNPTLIRRGFSQDVHLLSPFQAISVWDFEVLNQVYDTMLQLNPLTGGTGAQLVDWMTVDHSSSFNPTEVSCVSRPTGPFCVTGTTTQTWRLRPDLFFHDGTHVTAADVAYTILAYRDVPSANFQSAVSSVSSATPLDCGPGQACKTVQVKLQLQSPFYEINIGTLPIIPKHIWAPICGNPASSSSPCASPAFDPMASGVFVGSGPWVCKSLITGAVGGSCSQNGDGSLGGQAVTLNGRILLTANQNYMRGPASLQGSSFQRQSWADKNDAGIVDILDLSQVASHFCVSPQATPLNCAPSAPDPYWSNPLLSPSGYVGINEVAAVAMYFDVGITSPWAPSQLTGLDPHIDPFNFDLTSLAGPVMYYEGGLRTSSGQLPVKLVVLSGTANPPSFTATLSNQTTTLGPVAGSQGSSSGVVLLTFSGVSSGSYTLNIFYTGSTLPVETIRLSL
jgi:hypothetical protein